jgi:hypothetical protein
MTAFTRRSGPDDSRWQGIEDAAEAVLAASPYPARAAQGSPTGCRQVATRPTLEEPVEPQQRQHPSSSQQQNSRGRERDGDLLALLDKADR